MNAHYPMHEQQLRAVQTCKSSLQSGNRGVQLATAEGVCCCSHSIATTSSGSCCWWMVSWLGASTLLLRLQPLVLPRPLLSTCCPCWPLKLPTRQLLGHSSHTCQSNPALLSPDAERWVLVPSLGAPSLKCLQRCFILFQLVAGHPAGLAVLIIVQGSGQHYQHSWYLNIQVPCNHVRLQQRDSAACCKDTMQCLC